MEIDFRAYQLVERALRPVKDALQTKKMLGGVMRRIEKEL